MNSSFVWTPVSMHDVFPAGYRGNDYIKHCQWMKKITFHKKDMLPDNMQKKYFKSPIQV